MLVSAVHIELEDGHPRPESDNDTIRCVVRRETLSSCSLRESGGIRLADRNLYPIHLACVGVPGRSRDPSFASSSEMHLAMHVIEVQTTPLRFRLVARVRLSADISERSLDDVQLLQSQLATGLPSLPQWCAQTQNERTNEMQLS